MQKLQRWQAITENVHGFFLTESAVICDVLLEFQNNSPTWTEGDLAEIGVLHGKSATLAALHSRQDEALILCDQYFPEAAKQLISGVKPEGVTYLEVNSANLVGSLTAQTYARRCRWVHVDGEHTGQGVTHDLILANHWLNDKGIICCDDFMNPAYPQVTASIFRFLDRHSDELTMFLCGVNKCYLTRPKASHHYLEVIRDRFYQEIADRGFQNCSICKTTVPSDMNCFGVSQGWVSLRFGNYDYYGLDEDPSVVVI